MVVSDSGDQPRRYVVKIDGLATGKGVYVTDSWDEASDLQTVDHHWREVADCHCAPGDGIDECLNYDRCYAVWYDFNRRPGGTP